MADAYRRWPLGLVASSGLAIRLVGVLGTRLIALGSSLLAAAMAALSLTVRIAGPDLAGWLLVPGLLVGGIGFGLVGPGAHRH